MAINRDKIVNRIVNQMPSMGIQTKVDGDDSHTVKLVRAIVDEIINEIVSNAEIKNLSALIEGTSPSGPVTGRIVRDSEKGGIK